MATLPDDFLDPRRQARTLYWNGWRIARIAEELHIAASTIHSWKRRDGWSDAPSVVRVQSATESRLIQLINLPSKGNSEYKEMDALARMLERAERMARYRAGGRESDLNPKLANRGKGERKPPTKNVFTDEETKRLREAFFDSIFTYQRGWYDAGLKHRIRNILKSRQIGATWYFAREALLDSVETGRNQLFLSASKAQAHVFKNYIIRFASDAAGVELKGDPIILANGAEMRFLGTNAATAQSYTGNLYFDEYFWVPRFLKLRQAAAGMAMQKHWRLTYFSTPSIITHEGFKYWSGALYNRKRKKSEQVEFDISHAALANGRLCEDRQWRQIVTIMDAIAGGCNLFDLNDLRDEFGPEEFANLLMCEFIDDSASIFPFLMLTQCLVDSWELWEDFKPLAFRRFDNREVWIGYDPAHTGDSAACVVVAPPLVPDGPFRILEKFQWKGMDFQAQADQIRDLCGRYNVGYIGIDVTGLGQGVYQLVKQFYPRAEAITYNVDLKVRMVLKMLDVLRKGRLEFDAGWNDLITSFLAIHKTTTPSGRQITFNADRSEEAQHADLAWATMHAIAHEPLEGMPTHKRSIAEIY